MRHLGLGSARLRDRAVIIAKHRRIDESAWMARFPPMLQSLTLPASWRALPDSFRPVFRRSRTYGLFTLLATGLVAQTGRRTVVGMLAATGMAAVVSFHACCRFFSHHVWDADRIGLILARLIVSRLLPDGAPIVAVVDDTLIRRWGPKVLGAFWTHDGSARGLSRFLCKSEMI
jgi:DDE superfamily endonuclease